MIHIKIDDTIIDIVEKIEGDNSSDIILDFPLGHPILHNYISLKILKSKVGNKKLIIATNDRIGRKIGKQLGIEYSVIKDKNFLSENSSSNLMQHNFTFVEYFKFQVRSYFQEFKNTLDHNKKLNSLGKYSRIYQEKANISIFLGVLALSFLLLIFIYYFAVSKTYIYITPEITVKKEAYNFIFNKNNENNILGNNKYIKITTLSKEISLSETYSSSDIKNNAVNVSSGDIRLYNKGDQEITLIQKTRVQTNTGVVFELKNQVTIPPAVQDNFGNIAEGFIDTQVIAQLKDTTGNFIGTRGNILTETPLIIPGLDEDSQKIIYGKSISDFTGGVDSFEKMVSQKDIDQSQELFSQKLKTEVLRSLKDTILEENKKNNTKIDILSGGESIIYGEPTIILQEGIQAGTIIDSFEINGNINIEAYTYNKESIIQKLKTLVSEKSLEGVEKISYIDESSLRMSEIIYTQTQPFEMKATFEIEALFLHDFLHLQNTYIEQLKGKVLGLSKSEAIKVLINDQKISNVKIDTRPFFIKSVSRIPNNIIFKVQ